MDDMRSRGVPFTEINAQADRRARDEMHKLSGGLRVPVIVKPDGSVTVGFNGY